MALVNPNIAMSGQPVQIADPMAMYAQMSQIKSAQNQNALAQYQLGAAQRAEKSQNVLADAYAQATDPVTGAIDYNKLTGLVAAGGGGAQLPGIQKARVEQQTAQTAQQKAQSDLLDAKLKQSRGFLDTLDPADPTAPARYLAWHEANHKDPIIGAALTARGVSAEAARQNIEAAIAKGPAAFAQMLNQSKLGTEKFMEMNRPTTQVVDQSGQRQVLQIPGLGGAPTTVGTFPAVPLPADVEAQKSRIAKSGAPSITVSTEKKYGEAFGGKMAEADIGKLATAEKAPQLAESANRIIDIVKQGNVFTGPAADIKLNLARALNVAGANNQDKIANTESLIAASGQSTLDAIKSAGLGTGQGFTDKDLKFLQGIAGGTIGLTAQTLTELATLQHRAATRSAAAWNKRVLEMPKEVLQGTGLSTTPISVPALTAGKAAGPSAGTVQDGYRFKGGSPADPKNWEKM